MGRPKDTSDGLEEVDAASQWARRCLTNGDYFGAEKLYRMAFDAAATLGAQARVHAIGLELVHAFLLRDQGAAARRVLQQIHPPRAHGAWQALACSAAVQSGDADAGKRHAMQAVQDLPADSPTRAALARALLGLHKFALAAKVFRALLNQESDAAYHGGLARALCGQNNRRGAEAAFAAGAALDPHDPDLMLAHVALRRSSGPEAARLLNNAARRLWSMNRFWESERAFERAVEQSRAAALLNDLGAARYLRRDHASAIVPLQAAVNLDPSFSAALANLGAALLDAKELDEAERVLNRAIAASPDNAEALVNLANLHLERRRIDEAIDVFREARSLRPDLDAAELGLGIALMLNGKLTQGLAHYEARPAARWLTRRAQVRHWRQNDRAARLVAIGEQGFGDCLQFMRYLPRAALQHERVSLVVPAPLFKLAAMSLPGIDVRLTPPSLNGDAAAFISLASTASFCADDVIAAIEQGDDSAGPHPPPARLVADPDRIAFWRARLADHADVGAPGVLRVGLCWGGGDDLKDDALRSIPLSEFAPLVHTPNVACVSLQVGTKRGQLQGSPLGARILDVADDLVDFAETAALIHNLDVVISVDTAVAHLAGGMDKPVWLLNRHASEWRWGVGKAKTPWYRSMSILNQRRPDDWRSVIDAAAAALGRWAQGADAEPLAAGSAGG